MVVLVRTDPFIFPRDFSYATTGKLPWRSHISGMISLTLDLPKLSGRGIAGPRRLPGFACRHFRRQAGKASASKSCRSLIISNDLG